MSPDDPRHGLNGYSNLGCRCEICRAANTAWQLSARARRAASLADDDPRHGKSNTYLNHGCRCGKCRSAHAVVRRAQYARQRARERAS